MKTGFFSAIFFALLLIFLGTALDVSRPAASPESELEPPRLFAEHKAEKAPEGDTEALAENEEKNGDREQERKDTEDGSALSAPAENVEISDKTDSDIDEIQSSSVSGGAPQADDVSPADISVQEDLPSSFSAAGEVMLAEPQAETANSLNLLNARVRDSVVNILCTSKASGLLHPSSGSGVIISPSGIILTSAHVAQYYLLEDYLMEDFINCSVRRGSPARPEFQAELVYISGRWIAKNASAITEPDPSGSGEHDYAILSISSPIGQGKSAPSEFPFISPEIDDSETRVGDSVLLVGYPAGFLGGVMIQKDLYMLSAVAEIKQLFTFRDNTFDTFSISANAAAQKGFSGGAVARLASGGLLGIASVSTEEATTNERTMRAITVSHVSRSLKEETGFSLSEFLQSDIDAFARRFREEVAPAITEILIRAIEGEK